MTLPIPDSSGSIFRENVNNELGTVETTVSTQSTQIAALSTAVTSMTTGNAFSLGTPASQITNDLTQWNAGIIIGSIIYALCQLENGCILGASQSGDGKIYKSYNNGQSWDKGTVLGVGQFVSIIQLANGWVLAFENAGTSKVYKSTNNGITWDSGTTILGVSQGFTDGIQLQNGTILVIEYTSNALYKSTDNGSTWSSLGSLPSGITPWFISQLPNGTVWCTTNANSNVYESTDNGSTWSPVVLVPGVSLYKAVNLSNGNIIIGGNNQKIYTSTNGGTSLDSGTTTPFQLFGIIQLLNGWLLGVDSGTPTAVYTNISF